MNLGRSKKRPDEIFETDLIFMKPFFGFCLRFFCSFVVAKLLLRAFEADSPGYLLGLSLLFTLNLYWFDFSKYSDQWSSRQSKNRE